MSAFLSIRILRVAVGRLSMLEYHCVDQLVECHSRKLYLEFTHSQSFETFVRCHIHALEQMAGCARELWYDNLATAVAEHDGNLVR